MIDTEVETLEVEKVAVEQTRTIDTEEFRQNLAKELSEGNIWRTSVALAKKLNVDVKDMEDFLDHQKSVCCKRGGKDDNEVLFYYALLKRLEKAEPQVPKEVKSSVKEEDRYAFASLYNTLQLYQTTLEKYALRIAEVNQEAFTNLIEGKNRLESGVSLLSGKLKVDVSKLPKI